MLGSSQSVRSDYFTDAVAPHRRPSTEMSSLLNSNTTSKGSNHSDFSPHFLAAAAAASAQAEAVRSAGRFPSSSSSSTSVLTSMSPAPPLPYLDSHTPFPLALGDRVVISSHKTSVSDKGKSREEVDEMGRVRCCWAILSTRSERLDFLYVDPTFSQYLSSEAEHIKGTSFFDYIHSEEEERTRADMKNIIESRTLFGSVTRCRYSTISHIQSILKASLTSNGASNSSAEGYLPIDIVVNWIGEDMALCFFHAILDESPQDNDELHKTDWSNWCGMQDNSIGQEECQSIWKSIQSNRSLTSSTTGPQYVFQVLSAVPTQQANTATPNVLFSWPPPRLFASPTTDAVAASAINFADGSYFVDDFARLAQGVDQLTLRKELSDANTSCTRRFRAKHTLTTESMIRSVESVLIPYGSIVLACFSVTYAQMMPGSSAAAAMAEARTEPVDNSYQSFAKSTSISENASVPHKNGVSMPASSLSSLVDASTAIAQSEAKKTGLNEEGAEAGGSVATLAAVAAAASAQSKKCANCGSSNSPEWRKGPDGSKSLCNACGLRYSRNISRAKKRDERARIAAEVAANGGIIPPHLRKKPGEEKVKVKRNKKSKRAISGEANGSDQARSVAQLSQSI